MAAALTDALAAALEASGNDLYARLEGVFPWKEWPEIAAAILADPAFRAALTAALAEALDDHEHPGQYPGYTLKRRRDHLAPYIRDCASAIIAAMLPAPGLVARPDGERARDTAGAGS